jgi:2-dehydro-3-deoxygalactonokinase
MRNDGAAADGVPDVMRGEETQLMGAAAEGRETGDGLFVLPGTHSKWAVLRGGRIAWFATFMTGELFAVLSQHSILGRLMTAEESGGGDGGADADAAFDRGVAAGLAAPGPERGGLIRRLFGARTLALFGRLSEAGVRPYLSGLLIGGEIAEARQCLHLKDRALLTPPLTVIGAAGLAARYERAFAAAGIAARRGPEDAAARGLVRLAAAAASERGLRP